jgi:AraC family transcriptional regulator of adaptative response/methylated-DNA-[protein]-cysteine methyltransferase
MTPLGPMRAISDDEALYFLEFDDSKGFEWQIEQLKKKTQAMIIQSSSIPIRSIERELKEYFSGNLKKFTTPIHMIGSIFQQKAWYALMQIPYGETRSYREQAQALRKPTAFRAVANANGANKIAFLIPCHRIINNNGELGGYGGGLGRKLWLLEHEHKYSSVKINHKFFSLY